MIPDPTEEIVEHLFALVDRLRAGFEATAATFELSVAQAKALRHVAAAGPVPMGEVACRLRCDASNVTGIVDRLEARGLVTRRAGERDRRVKYIVPTPLGLEVREAMRERMARAPAAIERLSVKEQRLLRDLLARAARAPRAGGLR